VAHVVRHLIETTSRQQQLQRTLFDRATRPFDVTAHRLNVTTGVATLSANSNVN
jgi:hypothetical protein